MEKPEIFLFADRCSRCGQCVGICPTGASTLLEDHSTIDRNKCIGCAKCVEICPNEARALVGRYMTVDEVMEEVIRDRKFYDNSGGGVTLSGGEPAAQPEFALSILRNCKEEGLHTVLDTCGCTTWTTIKDLLKYTDLVLYDIKCLEPKKHCIATGKSNNLILKNAREIAKRKAMRVRVPLIPGFNDSSEQIITIAKFVATELGSVHIDLLPYNNWGEGKYERLGRRSIHLEKQTEEYLENLNKVLDAGK
jgi:pyruvate formate lyase activating enzyme